MPLLRQAQRNGKKPMAQLEKNSSELDRRRQEVCSLKQEEKKLAPVIERAEHIEALLEEMKLREKLGKEYALWQKRV